MPLVNELISALLNLLLLAGIPFLVYFVYQRWRHGRRLRELANRVGLCLGEPRYLGYSVGVALAIVAYLVFFPPSLAAMIRQGSSWHSFNGLGLGVEAVCMALLYGVVKTGFAEEFLFRGMIAGSLARRLPLVWANLLQAIIFLLPHLLLLLIMPELWWLLLLVFVFALLTGWLRIKSGSILGPWLIHATANVAMGLSVAIRTAAGI